MGEGRGGGISKCLLNNEGQAELTDYESTAYFATSSQGRCFETCHLIDCFKTLSLLTTDQAYTPE